MQNLKPLMKEKVLGEDKLSLTKRKPNPFGKLMTTPPVNKGGLLARLTGGK